MIEARVIRIFDDRTVAINVGSSQGVQAGMRFGIYTPFENVVDPQTNAVLGRTRRRKAIIEAANVEAMFTIATAPTRVVRTGSAIVGLEALQGKATSVQDSLPVNRGEVQPYETGTEIRVGDHVEQIVRTTTS